MDQVSSLSKFAEYGLVGICLFALILVGALAYIIYKLSSNHINHNTEILTKMTEKIDQDIKAQKETSETMRELKDYIRYNRPK